MLSPQALLELAIEKPAAGGRMIARHEGQIILVRGAIPGERVRARIEKAEKTLAFASVEEVIDASPDRRDPGPDPLCGGNLYAHIRYPRQLEIKADVIADAFARLGRVPLETPVTVAASPERGYRMRARLHARGSRLGSYREGTHDLCDFSTTGQLRDVCLASAAATVSALVAADVEVSTIEIGENLSGDQRAAHIEVTGGVEVSADILEQARAAGNLTGCSVADHRGNTRTAGVPYVGDPLATLSAGRAGSGELLRHAQSFFQANRFLLPNLVSTVIDLTPPDGRVLELYAGVGLFSISLAACGREGITAVEGDGSSGRDLLRNASAAGGEAVRVMVGSVEDFLSRKKGPKAATIIVDPPRTGISKDAMKSIVTYGASRVIYVSCDPATMARDARRLLDGDYKLERLEAFDLFPNTPHVESVGLFTRAGAPPR